MTVPGLEPKKIGERFDYGYALTVHQSQGMTCERALLLGSDALYREAGYVGMSRGRQVSAPVVSMHFARSGTLSCGSCHDNKRAFGGTDFADCKRCHQGTSFKF